ncbi:MULTISPECIES: hypothetical protein [Cysteiniphilum]|uniref:Uncharacterized protein n=1 Tax=Cysteiniphilum litorale TaxID=2056700 RepID=A0A8J2Z5P3_9GAMM|nr:MULTISPECIES: hypothetical protein [Cysteiniphilum]GGG03050.1 hypothetical protein GCM10010995_20630 [Cysteiniphilum litorale]
MIDMNEENDLIPNIAEIKERAYVDALHLSGLRYASLSGQLYTTTTKFTELFRSILSEKDADREILVDYVETLPRDVAVMIIGDLLVTDDITHAEYQRLESIIFD